MAKPRKPAAPEAPAPAKLGPFDEQRPDAPVPRVVTHARRLAKQVRVDLGELTRAKITAADADRLEAAADAADAAQNAWLVAQDARPRGTVAAARRPLRAGRDQLFAALRTFAPDNARTQEALDQIAGVRGDDDLEDDTEQLLSLADEHRDDLAGTDLTDARVAEVRAALAVFAAVRVGTRAEGPTAQVEARDLRALRRARNRTFWALAALDRQVCSFAQYGFRADAEKRAKYGFYRRNGSKGAAEPGPEG